MIGQMTGRTDLKDSELREWFAGQALPGLMANATYPPTRLGGAL